MRFLLAALAVLAAFLLTHGRVTHTSVPVARATLIRSEPRINWGRYDAHATTTVPPFVYIQDDSTVVTPAALQDALPVFQKVTGWLTNTWHTSPTALIVTDAPPAGAWVIHVLDDTDTAYALGYHSLIGGIPYANVYVRTSFAWQWNWQVTLTHELDEMLVDPMLDKHFGSPPAPWPLCELIGCQMIEVSDPVQSGRYAILRRSPTGAPVSVSDFVLPAYYRKGSRGPYDMAGYAKRPLQVLPGGYQP